MSRRAKDPIEPPAPKAKPSTGHNSALTDDERAALTQYYALKIRGQQKRAAEAKASYDIERNAVNALFSTVRGDIEYTRAEFTEILACQDMTEAQFIRHEQKRTGRLIAGGLRPPQAQMELALGDTVDDKNEAYANGYRAGRRADDLVPPDHISPILHPDWMKGWHDGQAANILQTTTAEEIIAARMKPVELQEDDGLPELDPEAEIAAEVKRLKDAGFADKPAA